MSGAWTSLLKAAQEQQSSAMVQAPPSTAPVPEAAISPLLAPGKRGPVGMAARTNYSRVNSGTPPTLDSGAEQKSLQPKFGSAMNITGRPSLNDLVAASMRGSLSRTKLAEEGKRQQEQSDDKHDDKKDKEANIDCGKMASISTEDASKIAGALDFLSGEFKKSANATPGTGPGALEVSQATAQTPLPDHKGQATPKNVVPMTTPLEPGRPKGPANSLETNEAHRPGGSATVPEKVASSLYEANLDKIADLAGILAMPKGLKAPLSVPRPGGVKPLQAVTAPPRPAPKVAEDLFASNLARLGIKVAEDAINPAHISAGPAVPPDTSASGQPGGEPAGGAPQGPTGLVSSNQAAINYTRGQAYENRKTDMKKWLTEPMDSAAHDNTLQVAFDHTREAGPKIASTKTAAARALLEKLAQEVQ